MDILNILIEITIYSAVILAVTMLLKICFKNKMSPFFHYAVWIVLIVRLMMPFTFTSPVQLFKIPAKTQEIIVREQTRPQEAKPVAVPEIDITGASDTQSPDTNQQSQEATAPITNSAAAQQTIALSPSEIILIIWLAGTSICILYLIGLYSALRRKFRRNAACPSKRLMELFQEVKTELGIKANVRLICQYEYGTPSLMFPKTIMMPVDALVAMNDEQAKFALRHELVHYKRKDHTMSILLSLLNAVYWFNPFVWFAFRQIRADMETACDGAVVKKLDAAGRTRYASLIIRLFSQPMHRQLVLGMAQADARKVAEQRIRGIYMKGKSKKSVKFISAILTMIIVAACFTTACQPTPEEPIVVNKADGLSNLIEATPDTSGSVSPSGTATQNNDALYTKLEAPKHWTFETTALGGNINITADVDIELPNVSKLPAATASLSEFTQEDLNKIAEVLGIKGSEWTEVVNVPSKERIKQWIIEDKEEIANSDNSFRVEKVKDNLEAHEQMYIDAPYESELIKILTEFEMSEVEYMEGTTGVRFEGTTIINEQPFYFFAGNYFDDNVRTVRANFGSRPAGFWGTYSDEPYEVSLTKEQAAEQANKIAKQLTDELTLCYVVPTAGHNQEVTACTWGWACVFMREINGCPTAYESTDVGSSMESEIREPIRYEKMVIVMGDMGMLSFIWENPMTIESIDNPDVTLLSFDEISQRAAAQIGQHWVYSARDGKDNEGNDTSDPGCTAIITKVELGLMRVAKADSDDYYYIPVWNFFTELEHSDEYWERMGEEPFFRDDRALVDEDGNPETMTDSYPQAWGAVTINALDGSVIDKDLGY